MAKSKAKGAKSPKRPDSVKIFFINYHINWYTESEWLMSPLDNDMQGQADSLAGCIHMRVQPHAHEQMLRETLWHEILHTLWWHMGLRDSPVHRDTNEETEEEIILRISHGIITVQQENPAVMAWLADSSS